MVSALLNSENQWDLDLIMDIFDNRDANIILSIPTHTTVEDSWYWRKKKMGNYPVKSAYLLLQENKNDYGTAPNSGFWRKLWNLKIPPKVKNFLLRASANCLPTKDLLRIRRIPVNDVCPTCNEYTETTFRTLVTCSYVVVCWSRVHSQAISGNFSSFSQWLALVFQQQPLEQVLITVMTCWMIWKH